MAENRAVIKAELDKIRGLEDFDLIMFISEIHDHGWDVARVTLAMMPPADQRRVDELRKKGKS